jgi:putative ABC transport system substrate-binding protein
MTGSAAEFTPAKAGADDDSCKSRRDFVLLGGIVAALPLLVRGAFAQQRVRRIGFLKNTVEGDPEAKAEVAAFSEELKRLGWIEGSNIHVDYRFGAGDVQRMAAFAKELVGLNPDVLLGRSTPAAKVLLAQTRAIPVVFLGVSDPIGEGFAVSLARPGGNATGFTNVESSVAGKWVELLKEIVHDFKRVAYMFNPSTAPGGGAYYTRLIESAAATLGLRALAVPINAPVEIEPALTKLAGETGLGLVVLPDAFMSTNRQQVIELAMKQKLPTMFTFGHMAREGALVTYGANIIDIYRRAAGYVDRILHGDKPGDLPIQAPIKFELMVNLKSAKAIGLKIPESFLLRADEVIE